MKIGDLLHWHDKPDMLAICIGLPRPDIVRALWLKAPASTEQGRSFDAYRFNFKKVKIK